MPSHNNALGQCRDSIELYTEPHAEPLYVELCIEPYVEPRIEPYVEPYAKLCRALCRALYRASCKALCIALCRALEVVILIFINKVYIKYVFINNIKFIKFIPLYMLTNIN